MMKEQNEKYRMFKEYKRKFSALPFQEKLLLFEAVFFLLMANLMLSLLPFRICVKFLKTTEFKGTPDMGELKDIRVAIARANRLAWWKNVCLVQSFTARWMLNLRRINSMVYIGVSNDDEMNGFMAHAWVTSHSTEIVRQEAEFVVLMKSGVC